MKCQVQYFEIKSSPYLVTADSACGPQHLPGRRDKGARKWSEDLGHRGHQIARVAVTSSFCCICAPSVSGPGRVPRRHSGICKTKGYLHVTENVIHWQHKGRSRGRKWAVYLHLHKNKVKPF